MKQYLDEAKQKFDKSLEHLKAELSTLRSGRATPALVEHIKVEAYGTFTPLLELASITAPEPKLLVVSPWDKGIIKEVERALQAANLGMSPIIDGAIIRLNLPPLSEERRKELVKHVNTKLEETRNTLRRHREDVLKSLKDAKSNGALPEDSFFAAQRELQKLIDEANAQVKKLGDEKDKEIMTI